jgi:hypothetical protein
LAATSRGYTCRESIETIFESHESIHIDLAPFIDEPMLGRTPAKRSTGVVTPPERIARKEPHAALR